jgi:predicted nucleic acid-binding protein
MEKTVDQPFIADSSALVSLIDENDHNHKEAVKAAEKYRQASRPIILPLDVFVETINVIGKKFGHDLAMKAARYLLSADSEFILLETRPYLIAALNKFDVQAPAVSLTDCIIMAIADDYGTKEIFGFDKQFKDAGYHRLTPSTKWK